MNIKYSTIAGLKTISVTRKGLSEIFINDLNSNVNDEIKAKVVFSSNGQGVSLATTSPKFKSIMDKADIIHADGMSVVWASYLKKVTLPERIATTDLIHDISIAADTNQQISYYFFGGSEESNYLASEVIKNKYPHISIVGRTNGYNFDLVQVAQDINNTKPDIVWVAFGKPMQEEISLELKNKIKHTIWIKTCGGLFDFLSGKNTRAPLVLQNLGLEWLHRLYKNPRKLFKRYLVTNSIAIYAFIFK